MNYIKRLQAEKLARNAAIDRATKEISDFVAFLQTSPKFVGVESDGGRKDWIATGDVVRRLMEIDDALTVDEV